MGNCPVLDCPASFITPPLLESNPDIAGIGVLVGFLATAYLALGLLIVHYVLVFNPAEAGLTGETRHVNPIDEILLKFVAKGVARPHKTWEKSIEKMVLMMSDQQMLTGIALLLSAATQLRCGISAYHWQIMIYLVWFSSFTHLATLTILRGYFFKNPALRLWRLVFMTILILLLIGALIPTGNLNFLPISAIDSAILPFAELKRVPALCLFQYERVQINMDNFTSMMFTILILCITYATRAIKLFERSSKFFRLNLRTRPGNIIKRCLHSLHVGLQNTGARRWILSVPYYVVLSTLLVIRSWLDLFDSMLWEITWLLMALIWGSLRLFALRTSTADDNFWGFGQCLATAMLIILLFSAFENYTETRWGATETTATSSKINGNDDVVDENRSSQPSHHTARESDQMITDGPSRTESSAEADISDQILIATGIDESPRRLARSSTILSIEERSMGNSTHQRPRSSQNEVEHTGQRQEDGILAEDSLEPLSLPAHERNYYVDRWYICLAVFNFVQTMLLSLVFLSSSEALGPIASPENILSFFTNQVDWIFLYAPLSSFAMTLSNVCLHAPFSPFVMSLSNICFPATQRRLGERPIWRSRNPNVNWLHLTLELVIFCSALMFSIMSFLVFTEYGPEFFLFGQLLPVFVIALLTVICLPWSWVISRKLKRQYRA